MITITKITCIQKQLPFNVSVAALMGGTVPDSSPAEDNKTNQQNHTLKT